MVICTHQPFQVSQLAGSSMTCILPKEVTLYLNNYKAISIKFRFVFIEDGIVSNGMWL